MGVYLDSGCWDTLLLQTLDTLVRLCVQGGGWVLSQGLGERGGQRASYELYE